MDEVQKGKSIGVMLEKGGILNMGMQDNASVTGSSNDKTRGVGMELHGEAKITQEDNALIQGGSPEQAPKTSDSSGAKQEGHRLNDSSESEGKICITSETFTGKGATKRLQVDRDDKVQVMVDKYGEPRDAVYCGEWKLDCDKTFAENDVKDSDVLKVGKEVIVTSNSGRQRVA